VPPVLVVHTVMVVAGVHLSTGVMLVGLRMFAVPWLCWSSCPRSVVMLMVSHIALNRSVRQLLLR